MSTERAYTHISGIGYTAPDGGTIAIHPKADVSTIGPTLLTEHGVAFGPLEINTLKDNTAGISSFEYLSERPGLLDRLKERFESSGAFLVAGGGIMAADQDEDDPLVSRRDLLKMGAVACGAYGLATPARAKVEQGRIEIARFTLDENDGGVLLRIADVVDDVLPTGTTYYVRVNDDTISEFIAGEDDVGVIPPGLEGDVEIATDEESSFWSGVGSYFADDEILYEFELDKEADQYEEGEEVVLSSEPIVTKPVDSATDDETVMKLGDLSVPHQNEDTDEGVGYYVIRHNPGGTDKLTYVVGDDAPSFKRIELFVNVSSYREAKDDTKRSYQ